MSVFMLDTDSVTGIGNSINSLVSSVDNIAGSVEGYDTSSIEGFNFSGVKAIIAENIKACAIKISNTSVVIDKVCSSHTQLQNSLTYGENNSSLEGEYKYSSGGSSGGYYYSGGSAASAASASTTVQEETPVDEVSDEKTVVEENVSDFDDSLDHITPKYNDEVKTIENNTGVVSCDYVDTDTLSDEGKIIFNSVDFGYNEAGFAVYDGLYVISCAESTGKVDDLVKVYLKDGTVVNCIVGQNDNDQEGIKFFVNEDYKEEDSGNVASLASGNISKIANHGKDAANTIIGLSNVPVVGEHTSTWSIFDDEWTVADTKMSIADYQKVIEANSISQDSDVEKYKNSCLGFSYLHASNLYNGVNSDMAIDAGNFKHADEFTSFYTDSKEETLNVIYSQIVSGKPVIMQVNGDKTGSSRHFVTVVGFKKGITNPAKLTEKDLLIIDSWDGKIQRMDQSDSRFMTTGADSGQSYIGYYLRLLGNKVSI